MSSRYLIVQPSVLQSQLDVASSQPVVFPGDKLQGQVVPRAVQVADGAIEDRRGWSVGRVDIVLAHALLADPLVVSIPRPASEILELLLSQLSFVLREGGDADGVVNWPAGLGEGHLVHGEHGIGELADEFDWHLQQSHFRIVGGGLLSSFLLNGLLDSSAGSHCFEYRREKNKKNR